TGIVMRFVERTDHHLVCGNDLARLQAIVTSQPKGLGCVLTVGNRIPLPLTAGARFMCHCHCALFHKSPACRRVGFIRWKRYVAASDWCCCMPSRVSHTRAWQRPVQAYSSDILVNVTLSRSNHMTSWGLSTLRY